MKVYIPKVKTYCFNNCNSLYIEKMFISILNNHASALYLHHRPRILLTICSSSLSLEVKSSHWYPPRQFLHLHLQSLFSCHSHSQEGTTTVNNFLLLLFSLKKQLRAKYDTFRHQLEATGKRVMTCQQLAENLLNAGHSESREIRQKQKDLR